MPFMVSVRRKVLEISTLVLMATYGAYLIFDNVNQDGQPRRDVAQTKANGIGEYRINALLLGGSNVMYSLSATFLSSMTSLNWYNLGLVNEAYNDSNYWTFIKETLSKNNRKSIRLVVYSSLQPLRSGSISRRSERVSALDGNRPMGWLPNRSLASRLYYLSIEKPLGDPLPIVKGDLRFDEKVCRQDYKDGFERETNLPLLERWSKSQLRKIKALFPNARIVFVVPSEYYGDTYNRELDLRVMASLEASVVPSLAKQRISFYVQPAFPSKDLTCDERPHSNEKGRRWRTEDLLISGSLVRAQQAEPF
jgi:hypothetical protein